MNRFTALATALTIGLCAISWGADDEAKRVRFINAIPGSPAKVTVGGKFLFPDVSFGTVTEYKSVLGDDPKVELTGTGQPSAQADLGAANVNYTILAMPDPDGSGSKLHVFTTSRINPNDTRAQITLINASSDVKAADLAVGAMKVHAGVNPGGHNGPDRVDAGSVTVTVRDGSQDKDLSSRQMDLMAGKSYSVVVFNSTQIGFAGDATGNPGQIAPMQPARTEPTDKSAAPEEKKAQDMTVPDEGATKPAMR